MDKLDIKFMSSGEGSIRKAGSAEGKCTLNLQKC
jgi:hypothetical protein